MVSFNSNYGRRDSYMQVVVNPRPYNISANTTIVDWEVWVYTGVTYWQGLAQASSLTIDGGSSLWSIARSDTYAVRKWYKLGSGSKTIGHNSDGKKSIAISARLTIDGGGAGPGALSIDTSMDLPTIPRASSIGTISGTYIGSSVTVNINRATSGFTHYVYYHLPGQTWQSVSTSAGTSASFTIPVSQSSFIPNATSGVLNIMIRTYSGSTRIGGDIVKSHTIHVPTSVVPSFSALTASEAVANVSSLVGAYVQTKSRISLAISNASGVHGSSITGYRISGHGINVTSSSGTTNTITTSGNVTYTATITDSRSRTASRTLTVSVLPYSPPRITNLSFLRCDANGTTNPMGGSVSVKGTVVVSSLVVGGTEKNSIKYRVESAPKGGSFTEKLNTTGTGTSKAFSDVFSGYGIDNSFDFRSRPGDIFGLGNWVVGLIPTGEVTQQWAKKTTSFGKMIDNSNYNIQAGTGGIHSEGPGYFLGSLFHKNGEEVATAPTDGTTENGTWVKYPDGTLIQQHRIVYSGDFAMGSTYLNSWNFPVSFKGSHDYTMIVSPRFWRDYQSIAYYGNQGGEVGEYTENFQRQAFSCRFYYQYTGRSSVHNANRVSVYLTAIGRWK